METNINLWAVLAAAASNMVVGSLWYGPVFGRQWMKLAGLSRESIKSTALTPAKAVTGGLVMALLMNYVLAHFADAFGVFDMTGAVQLAFWTWLGVVVPLTAGSWLWEAKPFKLFILNAAHWLVAITLATTILAYWR